MTHKLMDHYISNGGSLWMKFFIFHLFFHTCENVCLCVCFSCSLKKNVDGNDICLQLGRYINKDSLVDEKKKQSLL